MAGIELQKKVDRLLSVLDKDIEHLRQGQMYLNELRSFVIKRDSSSMEGLLETIRSAADSFVVNETRRENIRRELAEELGCKTSEVNLSLLERYLAEEKRAQLKERREQLAELTKQFRQEYSKTALLLSECTRLNRMLLDVLFGNCPGTVFLYNQDGTMTRQGDASFMNVHL